MRRNDDDEIPVERTEGLGSLAGEPKKRYRRTPEQIAKFKRTMARKRKERENGMKKPVKKRKTAKRRASKRSDITTIPLSAIPERPPTAKRTSSPKRSPSVLLATDLLQHAVAMLHSVQALLK